MTAIVAIETPTGVHLACDSAITYDDTVILSGPKWFRVGPVTVAAAGDVFAIRALRQRVIIPAPTTDDNPQEWGDLVLGPAIMAAMDGVTGEDDKSPTLEMLLAVGPHALTATADGAVVHGTLGYAAIGNASEGCLMTFAVTKGLPPPERVHAVVEAACLHNTCCALPVHYAWVRA